MQTAPANQCNNPKNFDEFLNRSLGGERIIQCPAITDNKGVGVKPKCLFLALVIVSVVSAVSVPLVCAQSASTAALTGRVTDPSPYDLAPFLAGSERLIATAARAPG